MHKGMGGRLESCVSCSSVDLSTEQVQPIHPAATHRWCREHQLGRHESAYPRRRTSMFARVRLALGISLRSSYLVIWRVGERSKAVFTLSTTVMAAEEKIKPYVDSESHR